MSDFLFELGIEEVPVSEIKPILNQLKNKFQKKLNEHLVEFNRIETAATNKRFMLYISKINPKANDREEQIKGPAKRIAYDENNQPTIPLQKFMEFNNLEPSDLEELETPKGVYMVVDKKTEGAPTSVILKDMIPEVLKELTFAKTMVWNYSRLPFVRPVRNLLALLDNQLLPFSFAGIHSSNFTSGHSLLSEEPIAVKSFRDYHELLHKNFVMVQEGDRKEKIMQEINDIQDEFNAKVGLTDHMLDDFVYNNEYPVVFFGTFDEKYLDLPSEIISTFMIREKKLLPVYDKNDNLMNMFVGVSNIPDENQHVRTGNERVIRATFEDAKFFWDNDRADDFIGLREQLKNVTFHKDLGTFYEKTDRLFKLVEHLIPLIGAEKMSRGLQMAALYCKNDLVTRMVREFPSLQGIMGGLYLKEHGDSEDTYKAVYSHYDPKGLYAKPVEHIGAAILSMADKIDNIAAFMSKGFKISSSKDPYGIRRDVNAIIKIIIDLKLDFNLESLIKVAAAGFTQDPATVEKIAGKVKELFLSRLDNVFKDFFKFRYDVVNSVIVGADLFIYRLYRRAEDVGKIVDSDSTTHFIALHRRLKNITKKSKHDNVSEEHLVEKEEKILFEIFKESKAKIETTLKDYQYLQACSEILEMKPVIDEFFDKVLVMAEDENIRANRIALLRKLDQLLSQIADFSLIVEEG